MKGIAAGRQHIGGRKSLELYRRLGSHPLLARRLLLNVRQVVIAHAADVDGCLDLVAHVQGVELALRFDGVLHRHGLHPVRDSGLIYGRGLVFSVESRNSSREVIVTHLRGALGGGTAAHACEEEKQR